MIGVADTPFYDSNTVLPPPYHRYTAPDEANMEDVRHQSLIGWFHEGVDRAIGGFIGGLVE